MLLLDHCMVQRLPVGKPCYGQTLCCFPATKEIELYDATIASAIKRTANSFLAGPSADSWVSMEPYLRLFHCILEDYVLQVYMHFT